MIQNKNNNGFKLSFIGGIGEVGKNMISLEYGNDMIVIDCGVSFPTDDMPGVDLVIPDFAYLQQNKEKIKGIVITHGHEDHIGAVPYVLADINVPVYGSRLSLALIENKLKEHKKVKAKLISVKPRSIIKLGCFTVEFIKVTHSVGGAMALAITTPVGVYFHTGDFKIDFTPLDNEGMDFARLCELGKKGVLLLTSDSTNAEHDGFSISEKQIIKEVDEIFAAHKKERIIIASFASNVHRMQQLLNMAEKYGRKVAFGGRSMINICETAHKIGELEFNKKNVIDIATIDKYEDHEYCILSTGTQGEPNSALPRMANGEFNKVTINENDLIILSSSAIPGNERSISDMFNQLKKRGAKIITNEIADVHSSGHAYKEELKLLHSLLKPKFFIPVHGEFRHLQASAEIALELGYEKRNVIIPELGDKILVNKNTIQKAGVVPNGKRLIDGVGIGGMDGSIMRERIQLSQEGMCMAVLTISKSTGAITSKPEIITRGFAYANDRESDLMEEAKNVIINTITTADFKQQEWNIIKANIRKNLSNYFMKTIRRKPLILAIILETR